MRQPDKLWEALTSVCHANTSEMTKSERGRYNKALKELREVGATPESIRARAGAYKMKYPNLDVTPTALAAHWSSLKGSGSAISRLERVQVTEQPEIPGEEAPLPEPSEEEMALNRKRLAEMMSSIGGGDWT